MTKSERESFFSALALIVCLSCGLSCAPRHAEVPKPAGKERTGPRIGFLVDSFVLERWQRDRDIFVARAEELGAEVIVRNANADAEVQNAQIRSLIEDGVDALVIIPRDADRLTEVIAAARMRGIKTISYDRLILNAGTDLYVSIDSQAVGTLMAKALVSCMPKGKYVIINGPKSDHNIVLLDAGVRAVLAQFPGISVVYETNIDNWDYELAFESFSSLISKGIEMDAVVAGNDGIAGAVVRALAERRRAGKLPVSGQDADIAACQRIVEGTQLMTVYKPIEILAKRAAELSIQLARGEKPEVDSGISDGSFLVPYYRIAPSLVDRENLDDYIIDSGFHRAEDVYRNVNTRSSTAGPGKY